MEQHELMHVLRHVIVQQLMGCNVWVTPKKSLKKGQIAGSEGYRGE